MKTFTVRELDREPGAVLHACDREGAVLIRRRAGRTFTLHANAWRGLEFLGFVLDKSHKDPDD